tara:strand:- start:5818 stop:6123 length:306 start_codon:yes stop_codon:yes gene_type:complete
VKTVFHRLFQRDIKTAIRFYDEEGGEDLGDRFFADVEQAVERITKNPKGTHFVKGRKDLRRAPLRTFPYHIIYEESELRLRFLILRHDRRHPSHGLYRKYT